MKQRLKDLIERLVASSDACGAADGQPFFEAPLLGVARLDDPLFADYQKIIGRFHLTPREWLENSFPGRSFAAGSVVVWILPVSAATRQSNCQEQLRPSRAWAQTRQFGEAFNVSLRRQVANFFREQGGVAMAPQLSKHWAEIMSSEVGAASRWSERHAAYAAGLGTFSLNDGLITEKGIAHRIGSVVTDLVLEADSRPYPDHLHNCLYHREQRCGACIKRCPVGALSLDGHDKVACMDYVYGTLAREVGPEYGVQTTGCGLCQTRVPCEERIPR